MASGSIIQEYLVGLGAQVEVKPFYEALAGMGKAVAQFSLGLGAMIAALKAALIATASALETLFYTAQRAGTTVESLKMLQFGMSQIGLTAEDASHALESLASALRLNPGNEGLLQHLGVQTRTLSGGMRDSTQVMQDFIARLSKMPFYIAAQYAAMFGINDRTLYQLLHNFSALQAAEAQWRRMAKQMGVDLDVSAKKSQEFMNSLRELGTVVELMWLKVSGVLIDKMRPEMDALRKFLLDHSKEIENFALQVATSLTGLMDDMVKLLPVIDQLVKSTIGWKDTLSLIADIVIYRIFGPLGFIASLLYQLYNKEQEMEKEHPGPKKKEDGSLDRDAPETKRFFEDNNDMTEGFRKFLYHWMPLFDPEYRKKLQGLPNQYKPASYEMPEGSSALGSGDQALPLGLRNNNPGNIRHWGDTPTRGGFAVFRSMQEGLAALRDNLLAYADKHGLDTIRGIISRWAPSSENNTGAYIRAMMKELGVGADEHLNVHDPKVLAGLMRGIVKHENGSYAYSGRIDQDTQQAALGGGSGSVTHNHIEQHNHYQIKSDDPKAVGREIKRNSEMDNASLVRAFRTAVLA